jgi:hypothetical protein
MTLLPLLVHTCVPCTILVRQTDALIGCLNRYSIVILTGKKPPANRAVCRGRQMRHCYLRSGLLRGTRIPKSSRVRRTDNERQQTPCRTSRPCDRRNGIVCAPSSSGEARFVLPSTSTCLRRRAMAIFPGPARLPKFPDVRYTNCNLLVLLTNKRY